MDKLSVVIIAKNEEKNLKELIPDLFWVDETVVLVDDRSSDNTFDISKNLGASVFKDKFIDFSQFKNRAISLATNDWVLLLDADERVSKELENEIKEVLEKSSETVAYEFPWKNYLGNKWLKYGGLYPDYHTRLFKKNRVQYDGNVHEMLIIDGKTGSLSGSIIHRTYKDFKALKDKVDLYSSLDANNVEEKNKTVLNALLKSVKRFVKVYFLLRGFLDGWAGFRHALELARYQWKIYQ